MNKIFLISVFSILTLNVMAQEKIVQTTGRTQLGTRFERTGADSKRNF